MQSGSDDVGRVEGGLDALKQYESEIESAGCGGGGSEVVVRQRVVFEDIAFRTIPPRHVREAAVEGRSPARRTPTRVDIKRRALRALTREGMASAATLISHASPRIISLGPRISSLRRPSPAMLARSRALLSKCAGHPVAIAFACGVVLGGVVMQSLPAPTPTAEATTLVLSAPVAEPAPTPVLPVATTLVAETPDVVATPPSPPARPRRAAPSRPRFQGGLRINSQPTGAAVFVNNQRVGETPLVLPSLAAGSRAVRLELSGYAPWSRSVQVVANQSANVTARLETAQ